MFHISSLARPAPHPLNFFFTIYYFLSSPSLLSISFLLELAHYVQFSKKGKKKKSPTNLDTPPSPPCMHNNPAALPVTVRPCSTLLHLGPQILVFFFYSIIKYMYFFPTFSECLLPSRKYYTTTASATTLWRAGITSRRGSRPQRSYCPAPPFCSFRTRAASDHCRRRPCRGSLPCGTWCSP